MKPPPLSQVTAVKDQMSPRRVRSFSEQPELETTCRAARSRAISDAADPVWSENALVLHTSIVAHLALPALRWRVFSGRRSNFKRDVIFNHAAFLHRLFKRFDEEVHTYPHFFEGIAPHRLVHNDKRAIADTASVDAVRLHFQKHLVNATSSVFQIAHQIKQVDRPLTDGARIHNFVGFPQIVNDLLILSDDAADDAADDA